MLITLTWYDSVAGWRLKVMEADESVIEIKEN